ncbi:MAG: VWA domain-containing protein [Planctomycetota bacterium]
MRFTDPSWLALAALAFPIAWIAVRRFATMSRARRWLSAFLRTVLVGLLAGMLAGATAVRETERLAVIAVVDSSASAQRLPDPSGVYLPRPGEPAAEDMPDALRRLLARAGDARKTDDLLGIVSFDGAAAAIATPSRVDLSDRAVDLRLRDGSNLEEALRTAAALVPADATGRLLLISDGNQTTGDALRVARELAGGAAPIAVDVLPLAFDARNEVVVELVDAPPRAAAQSTVSVRVVLRSSGPASGTLRLLREGEAVDANGPEPGTGRRVRLSGGLHVERIEVPLETGRVHRFEAVFEPDGERADTHAGNNRGTSFTVTPGKGSVLMMGSSATGPTRALAELWRGAGLDVTEATPEGLPPDLLGMQRYDLIVLDSVPAEELSEDEQKRIAAYVRELGGGLLMIGGRGSFGSGGWRGSQIEPLLPMRLELPAELVAPETAIVFVIDRSGSMTARVAGSSRTQQEIANESTSTAIASLDPTDLVGVIAFDGNAEVVVPLGPNDDPEKTSARVMSISSGGGTDIGPAMMAARQQLLDADAKTKHVIVLSDGRSSGAELLPELAQSMADDGITITTIGVGDGADDQTMQAMATRGGGVYYRVVNPLALPRLFLKAVRIVRSPMLREDPFNARVVPMGSPFIAGLERELASAPLLRGLNLTQVSLDPTASTPLLSDQGEPLLAHWRVELGTVAAFTSDASLWSRDWQRWEGLTPFWTRLARLTSRAGTGAGGVLTAEAESGRLALRLEALDGAGKPRDLLSVPVTVYGPGGERREVTLDQTGPGVYEGELEAADAGSYIAVARPSLAGQRLAPVLGGASVAGGEEFRRLSADEDLLEAIAQATGGRVLTVQEVADGLVFDRAGVVPRRAALPMWRSLLAWALLVLMLDIGTRRVAWERLFGGELRRGLAERSAARVASRNVRAAETAGALAARQAAKRAQQQARRAERSNAESDARAAQQERAARRAEPRAAKKDESGVSATSLLAAKRRARREGSEPDEG